MLSYEGEHVSYIDHPKKFGLDTIELLETIPYVDGPKFHLTKCSTLEKYRDGRSDRYILIQNPNGDFPCFPHDEQLRFYEYKINAKLLPCKNCLDDVRISQYGVGRRKSKNLPITIKSFRPSIALLSSVLQSEPIRKKQ